MKTFLFNSEFNVYAAVAESKEEAISLIKEEIDKKNQEWWNDPTVSESTREYRRRDDLFRLVDFEVTIEELGYGFQGNFVLEPGKAIVYNHGNE